LQRAEWSLVRPTPWSRCTSVACRLRDAGAGRHAVPAYLFRPRPYVIAGAFAWAAGSMMLLVSAFDSGGPLGRSQHHHDRPTRHRRVVVCALIFGAALRLASAGSARRAISALDVLVTVVGIAWVIFGAALLPASRRDPRARVPA
jgi:hypothetical protein